MTKLFLGFVASLVFSLPVLGAAPCYEKILGGTYTCTIKYSNGTTTTTDVYFQAPSTDSDAQFDLTNVITNGKSACSCGSAGTFKNPKFKASGTKILCGSLGGGYVGKIVSGGKKVKLDLAGGNGIYGLAECVRL